MGIQSVLDSLPYNYQVKVIDQETKEGIMAGTVLGIKAILDGYNYSVTRIDATGSHYKIEVICD